MKTADNHAKEEEIKAYIKQTENPYCFFSGKTKVTMCFSDNNRTIEGQLQQYMIAMSTSVI